MSSYKMHCREFFRYDSEVFEEDGDEAVTATDGTHDDGDVFVEELVWDSCGRCGLFRSNTAGYVVVVVALLGLVVVR